MQCHSFKVLWLLFLFWMLSGITVGLPDSYGYSKQTQTYTYPSGSWSFRQYLFPSLRSASLESSSSSATDVGTTSTGGSSWCLFSCTPISRDVEVPGKIIHQQEQISSGSTSSVQSPPLNVVAPSIGGNHDGQVRQQFYSSRVFEKTVPMTPTSVSSNYNRFIVPQHGSSGSSSVISGQNVQQQLDSRPHRQVISHHIPSNAGGQTILEKLTQLVNGKSVQHHTSPQHVSWRYSSGSSSQFVPEPTAENIGGQDYQQHSSRSVVDERGDNPRHVSWSYSRQIVPEESVSSVNSHFQQSNNNEQILPRQLVSNANVNEHVPQIVNPVVNGHLDQPKPGYIFHQSNVTSSSHTSQVYVAPNAGVSEVQPFARPEKIYQSRAGHGDDVLQRQEVSEFTDARHVSVADNPSYSRQVIHGTVPANSILHPSSTVKDHRESSSQSNYALQQQQQEENRQKQRQLKQQQELVQRQQKQQQELQVRQQEELEIQRRQDEQQKEIQRRQDEQQKEVQRRRQQQELQRRQQQQHREFQQRQEQEQRELEERQREQLEQLRNKQLQEEQQQLQQQQEQLNRQQQLLRQQQQLRKQQQQQQQQQNNQEQIQSGHSTSFISTKSTSGSSVDGSKLLSLTYPGYNSGHGTHSERSSSSTGNAYQSGTSAAVINKILPIVSDCDDTEGGHNSHSHSSSSYVQHATSGRIY